MENSGFKNGNKISSLTASDPITITSDTDFSNQATSNGWSGSGTSANPYIIENLQIVNGTNSTNGISISNVYSTYFVIRNNYIEMTGSGSSGIYIYGTSNLGTIENNTLNNNTLYGIELYSSTNNTVNNNLITNSGDTGIYVFVSNSNTIENNTLTGSTNGQGIYLYVSSYVNIKNNNFSYNYAGLRLSSSVSYITVNNNTFTQNSNYAIWSSSSFTYSNITNNFFSYMGNSIMYFQSSTNNIIFSGNTFENNNAGGIRFASGSANNTFFNNLFLNNQYGINSNIGNSKIYDNVFIGNSYALRFLFSTGAYVYNNTFRNNGYAIYVNYNGNNTFIDNNVINNSYGIYFLSADNNTFYGNNFLHNTVQGYSTTSTNIADNGSFGNFWLDYVVNAVDANKDGIGDTPYQLSGSGNVKDNFPLMVWNNESLPLEFLKTVSNLTYSEGNAINYTWKLVDESPDSYVIYKDGFVAQSGSWNSSELLNISLPQSLGTYNYTFVANDTDGNVVSNTAFVHVLDVIAPAITGISYYSYNESTPGQFIHWNITDNHPDYYTVYKDGVAIDNNTWTANSTITIDVSGLLKNTYNYTLVANDTSNNIQSFTTFVDVYDGTPPNVTDYGNQTYEGGSTGINVTWTATDNYPAYYEIYNNSVLIANNTWTSNINISQVISSLSLGQFNFTIIVFDQSGNNISDTIFITFIDTTPPVITSSPGNSTYLQSTTGHAITWSAMDFFPSTYTVYNNGSLWTSSNWITDSVNVNIDGLSVGLHNLTIYFNDTSGNAVTNTVWVTVTLSDTMAPVIIDHPTVTIFQDIQLNKNVSWTAIDNLAPSSYVLFINGSVFATGSWQNGTAVVIPFSGLSAGLYNFTIVFNDTTGNVISETVWVTIFSDLTPPTIINSPLNSTYEDISTGNIVSWLVTDDYGASTYVLYANGSIFATGSWLNNTLLYINIDGLPVGLNNLTILFNDTSNNFVNKTFWVTVYTNSTPDTIAPSISGTISYTYKYNSTGNILTLNASDSHPDYFELVINGTLKENSSWNNDTLISVNLDNLNLNPGTYNFTFIVFDKAGNSNSHMVLITVEPAQPTSQPPTSDTSQTSSSLPSSSVSSNPPPQSSSRSTITQSLSSNWNVFILFISFVTILLFRSKRKLN